MGRLRKRHAKQTYVSYTIFIIFGLAMFYHFSFQPLREWYSAQSWVETPCQIVSAELGSRQGKKNNLYSVNIVYQYTYEGKEYRSDIYSILTKASSDRTSRQAVIDKYINNTKPICYVNPAMPEKAVLNREFSNEYVTSFAPLLFVLFGCVGILSLYLKKARAKSSQADLPTQTCPPVEADSPDNSRLEYAKGQPVEFKASNTTSNLLVLLVIAALWNGVVAYYALNAFNESRYIILCFTLPFAILGLILVFLAIVAFMQLFNPKLNLTLSSGTISPGTKAIVNWEIIGNGQKVKDMTFMICCYEMNRQGSSGKKSVRKAQKLYSQLIAEIDSPGDIGAGSFTFVLPANSLTSFSSKDYERSWSLEAKGTIKLWPDIREKHKFSVKSSS